MLPCAILLCGCSGATDPSAATELPRPVSTITLRIEDRSSESRIAGSVAAWKTEELGFEVSGRLEFVIEPEEDVEGRIFSTTGTVSNTGTSAPVPGETGPSETAPGLAVPGEVAPSETVPAALTPVSPAPAPAIDAFKDSGTVLARVDDTRYKLNVASVDAQIETLSRQKESQQIEFDDLIPAQKLAAEAELNFQESEIDRIKPLKDSGVVTQAEYDRTFANREAAAASVAQVLASLQAKKSEIASTAAKILEQNQALKEAERDLADCELKSSFRGQVAEVHVIPGAYVERGQPVVTVQMTDPIKIEFEASAATTRKLNYSDLIPIHVTNPDGKEIQMNGYLYMVDPSADRDTRTYTVTLLTRNEKVSPELPDGVDEKTARVDGLRKIMTNMNGFKGTQFIDNDAVYQDAEGHYIWKVESRTLEGQQNERSPVVKVSKIRIDMGQRQQQLLGNWTLQEIQVRPGQDFDQEKNLVARKILLPPGQPAWEGDTLVLDQSRWLMRPGDLVRIDVKDDPIPPGYYIPMNAIVDASPSKYVYTNENGIAKRVAVNVTHSTNTYKRIEPVEAGALGDGDEVIVSGVHYLVDGESIVVSN
ncbi:MAG: multidrug efflux pump subunit AcrA (membrane-fusion protein) [Pirellulaceae bacterium]|jgi:multidrug efflux pump subunit AcrA (membrane-fusion protein)